MKAYVQYPLNIMLCLLLCSQLSAQTRSTSSSDEVSTQQSKEYILLKPDDIPELDRSKISFQARPSDIERRLGRRSFEIINVDLSKGRPTFGDAQARSLPFDIPFYVEGKVSNTVNEVYVVLIETDYTMNHSYDAGNVESVLEKLFNEDNVEELNKEGYIRMYIEKNGWINHPDIQIGHWVKPSEFVVPDEDSKHNEFSVMINQIESGKSYTMHFITKRKLEKSKRDKIVEGGIERVIKSIHLKFTSDSLYEKELTDEILTKIIDYNFSRVNPYVFDQLRQNKMEDDGLKEKYQEIRSGFLPRYRMKVEDYITSMKDLYGKDTAQMTNVKSVYDSINLLRNDCKKLHAYIYDALPVNTFNKDICMLRGTDAEVGLYDVDKRIANIDKYLKIINKIKLDTSCSDVGSVCQFKRVKKNINDIAEVQKIYLKKEKQHREVLTKYLGGIGHSLLQGLVASSNTQNISSDSDGTFMSRTGELVIPDFGVMHQFGDEPGRTVRPFFGVHFYPVRVNRQRKYSLLSLFSRKADMTSGYRLLKPFSFTTGFTFFNNFEDTNQRTLISAVPINLYAGLGIRITDFGRFNIGKVYYRERDQNILKNETKIKSDLFISLSVDFYITDFLGNAFKWLF